MIKRQDLKTKTHIKIDDDPGLYENIVRIIALAVIVASLDKKEAEKVQKTYFENL